MIDMFGPLDNMFDFNGDGELNAFERAAEFDFLDRMEKEDSTDTDDDDDLELDLAGLNRDELEFMDEDERREALEDAGLDPDDYDVD